MSCLPFRELWMAAFLEELFAGDDALDQCIESVFIGRQIRPHVPDQLFVGSD
jgi:hypothetical protein